MKKLNGKIVDEEELEEEEEEEEEKKYSNGVGVSVGFPQPDQNLVVGYALTVKKETSFLKPDFRGLARTKGIKFVCIDVNRPLSDQGPFDVVLHKDYRHKHPEVTVLDPPDAIQHLRNRKSMLQGVVDLNLSDCHGKVGVPRQIVVTKDPSSIPYEVTKAGLKLPLVAKPLLVDGTAKSHKLFVAYDQLSLAELEPPLVLQEFVNHGGIVFKVYIVGESITVVRRFSLPNHGKRDLSKVAGMYPVPRISSYLSSAEDADLDPSIAEHPPRPLLEKLATELRRRLGLRLFNIDMIREHGTRDVFYVIDINYFPGYGKMPDYERVFTEFLLSLVQSKYKGSTFLKGSF
ncbi:inositol-tetrakisphosphate 1-kinase 3-like isoform X2 [Quercus lobata]|uniref:inositol-tetrakisphosphate 1-kinase 3-like isoform X2 n=1 Tax=Quercus lobata TaxID=97700 RepID=UPI0012465C1E|nr:inositol-tetrakisphosphate 1-kinase 3-like isoform X2 [Quercus lobata]